MRTAIVVFSTHWGSVEGGVNAFNFDFVTALAREASDKHDVIAVVENSLDVDSEITLSGITFLYLDKLNLTFSKPESEIKIYDALRSMLPGKVEFWVGHDTITGEIAANSKKHSRQGFTVVFHHMNYGAYESSKDLLSGEWKDKVLKQHALLDKADIILAIGPKLFKSARDIVHKSSKKTIAEIIPGLSNIHCRHSTPHNFSIIVFGRLSERLEALKQGKLAVDAFASSVSHNDDMLTLIGVEDVGRKAEYIKSAQTFTNRRFALNISSQIHNRDELFSLLSKHTACLHHLSH